jgi:hypothetical protein
MRPSLRLPPAGSKQQPKLVAECSADSGLSGVGFSDISYFDQMIVGEFPIPQRCAATGW